MADRPKAYIKVKNIAELAGALRIVTGVAVERAGPNFQRLKMKMEEEGRDVAGNDLPQTEWQKSIQEEE